ncbi:DUF1380 family protein [Klebsiella aerogenes]|uniref:DUF1380 family protein n=1 Tax=Klebsiella aerogenes TaxID=548 RepID=UPI002E3554C6|nr:DUF1380 family protein [Klebsiella aerogenes]MED7793132.1 DUF1380 family protein [Klebsiella aerogenes]
MYGTRTELTARLAQMYPADEPIALFVWDTDNVRAQEEDMSDSEAADVLALIGNLPAEVWQVEGVSFATVQTLLADYRQYERQVRVPEVLLTKLFLAVEQDLWPQEWAARDAGQPVPEPVARVLSMVTQMRALIQN